MREGPNLYSSKLAILMLSCDKYSDLWDDFFNLKERFWPDCPYHCYLATDTKSIRERASMLSILEILGLGQYVRQEPWSKLRSHTLHYSWKMLLSIKR